MKFYIKNIKSVFISLCEAINMGRINANTHDNYIEEKKQQEKQNEINKQLIDTLSYKLGIPLKIDGFMAWRGKTKIDIFDFENKLRAKYGYDENKHGSLSNFIKTQFNEKTDKQIKQII